MVETVDPGSDDDGQLMPTALRWIVPIEIVACIETIASLALDDVLIGVADDHDEIEVLFDPLLFDRLECAPSTVAMNIDNLPLNLWR